MGSEYGGDSWRTRPCGVGWASRYRLGEYLDLIWKRRGVPCCVRLRASAQSVRRVCRSVRPPQASGLGVRLPWVRAWCLPREARSHGNQFRRLRHNIYRPPSAPSLPILPLAQRVAI